MLSEQGFIANYWITILWLVAAGAYSLSVVVIDVKNALKKN